MTQPVSSPKRLDTLVQCVDQRKRLTQLSKMPNLMSLSLERGDQPWLAKVDLEAVETRTLTEIKFKLDTGADVIVISEEDYKNVGRPKLCESTKTLVGANQTVLTPSGKFCGRLSRGAAMLEEDIYVLGSQKRSLLGRRACETLGLIRRVSVDTVESAEIYKRDHPKLFDGLGKIPDQTQRERTKRETRSALSRPNTGETGRGKCVHEARCQFRVLANTSLAQFRRTYHVHHSIREVLLPKATLWDHLST